YGRGIGEDQIGHRELVGDGIGDELGDGGRLADDDEIGFVVEEQADAGPHHGVVVEDEDPAGRTRFRPVHRHQRATGGWTATPPRPTGGLPGGGTGRLRRTTVPFPGAESIRTVPSRSRARSSMQSRPIPLPALSVRSVGSNPAPSSSTTTVSRSP